MTACDPAIQWTDALAIGLEGQGWKEGLASPFDRLPARAEALVPPVVWGLSRTATGLALRFRTGADRIHARWKLRDATLEEPNFNRCSFSGLDLYARDADRWRWVAATTSFAGQQPEVCLAQGLDGREREFLLYLPLRNPVLGLEIGVPSAAGLAALPPRAAAPLVFYGTSIVHGAYASHAGLVHPAVLGRRLDRPVVNLGFSGNARMEPAIADLLAEIPAHAYVIDALPNMDLGLVEERADAFIRRLRRLRPRTPIVLIEDFPRTNAWIMPGKRLPDEAKCLRFRAIHAQLVADGVAGLHYVAGDDLFGSDGEASIDGIHPGDLGYLRMADAMEPVLRRLG